MRVLFSVLLGTAAGLWKEGLELVIPSDSPERESLIELLHAVDEKSSMAHKTASLDRRRFWGNNKNACSASGDPDTANGDCFTYRWNLLGTYYPTHLSLKRLDKAIVISAYEAEGTLQAVFNAIDSNTLAVAGNTGSLDKPSSSEGLIADSKLLTDATAQLQRAAIASTSIMYDQVLNLTDTSSSSVKSMKESIASGFSNLMDQVKASSAKQASRAANNTQVMVKDANTAFSSAVGAVQASQNAVGNSVLNTTATNSRTSGTFTANANSASNRLSDAEDLVDSTADNTARQAATAGEVLADKIGAAAESVVTSGDEKAAQAATAAEGVKTSVQDQTSNQLDAAKSDWADAAAAAAAKAADAAAAADAKVETTAESMNERLTNATSATAAVISATQTGMQTRTNDAITTAKDAAAAAGTVATQANSGVSAVATERNQMAADAEAHAASAKQQLTDLVKSASAASGKSIQEILAGLGAAQTDAQHTTATSELESQDAIAKFLGQVGQDGTKVASAMASLQSTIAAGRAKADSDISTQFSGAVGKATETKTQLTGQLDRVGADLEDTEKKLNAAAGGLARDMQSKLGAGGQTAGAEVSSARAASAATAAKLLQSVLASAGEFTGSSEDKEKMLKTLLEALKSMMAETGSAGAALGATAESTDDQVADLFGDLGDSDDDAVAQIAREVKGKKDDLNRFGSEFAGKQSAQLGRMARETADAVKKRERDADSAAASAEFLEKNSLDKADRLRDLVAGMLGNTDSLVGETKSKSGRTHDDFESRMRQMAAKDDGVVTGLQGMLNQYAGDAMGEVGGFLTQLVGGKSADISNSVSKQQKLVELMRGSSSDASAAAARLQGVVDALARDSKNSRNGLIDKVLAVLDSTLASSQSFSGTITGLDSKLQDAKHESESGLTELTRSIQAEVLKIPMILTAGASKLQNDFRMASSDLDNNILKLKEKMATAQTAEEREAAMQGLVVLNKLQGIQQGVLEADKKLRTDIQQNAQKGMIDSSNVEGAMAGVLSAMSTINSQMDTSRLTVEANTETLGKQTATLVNGLNMLVTSSSDRVAHEAAQAAVESKFNLNMADARNKVRLAGATSNVNKTLQVFTGNAEKVYSDEANVRDDIDRLKSGTDASSKAIDGRISSVLADVMSNAEKVKSDASIGQSDVLTRLALVRMAMSNFLSLWNEYASSMDRKLMRFHSTDSEFVAQMERDLRARLGGSEQNVNMTDAEVQGLKNQVEMTMKDQIEYENFFNTKIVELKNTLKSLNDARNLKTLETTDLVNQFENYETSAHSQLKEVVKKLIDQFDDGLAGKVSEIDSWGRPLSFLEQEIHDLDAQVQEVI